MPRIAISLPKNTLEVIERECETTGETQSEFIKRLIEAFAEQRKEAELVAQYKRGYELCPETEEEMVWIAAAQKDAFPADYWDDEYTSGDRAQ